MAPRRLMDVCLAALEKQITDHADAQQMLEFLRDKGPQCQFDYTALELKCQRVIHGMTDSAFINSVGFLELRQEILAHFLKHNQQIDHPELELYKKLNEWALKRLEVVDANVVDQKRAILGTLPTLLKFELITAEKFENEIVPMGFYDEQMARKIRDHYAEKRLKLAAYASEYAHKYTTTTHAHYGNVCQRLQHEYDHGHSAFVTARNMSRHGECPYKYERAHARYGCAQCLSKLEVQEFFDTLAQRMRRAPRRCQHGETDFKKCQWCW